MNIYDYNHCVNVFSDGCSHKAMYEKRKARDYEYK